MAKDIKRHLSHLKSSGTTAPAAADLLYGEIAVGYLKDNEALYIKNSNGDVVTFTTAAGSEAMAENYADSGFVSTVTGDTEITVTLSDKASSGRTLTVKHATGSAQSGFKKLASDSYGHITGGTAVALSDLTGLGALSGVTGENGISASTPSNGNVKVGLETTGTAGTYKQVVVDKYGRVTSGNSADNNTFREIKVNGTSFLASSTTTALNLSGGTNVKLTTGSTGLLTISASNTTYSAGTAAQLSAGTDTYNGLWSASSLKTGGDAIWQAKGSYLTGVTLASGTNNGTLKLTVNGSATDNIAVKGLGTAAYKAVEYFAGSGHTHTNMVTGSGLTANNIIVGSGSSVVKDSGKSIETSLSSTLDTKIPTSKAVADYVTSQMTSVLTYKGTVNSNSDLPATHKVGDVWVVATNGTYAGKSCEVGDYIICKKAGTAAADADWDVVNGENQVENKSASLAAAGSSATIATVDGTDITITTPSTWTGVNKVGTLTGVTLASGTNNGTLKLTVNGSATDNIAVKGLGTAAYKAVEYFAGSGHTHDGRYAKNAFAKVTIGSTTIEADTTADTLTVSAGTFVSLTPDATNDKFTIDVNTGATSGTVAVGNHTHSSYVNQNAFSNVKLGSSTIAADSTTDTLEIVSGNSFIGLTADTTNDKLTIGVNTGATSGTVAVGNHTHSGTYATNTFSKVKINAETTTIDADSTGDTLTISGGTFISLTSDATNDKFTINVNTGTSSSTVAVGNHTHSSYANQNAFSNIKVGSTTVAAASTTDTVEFSGGTGITITGTNSTAGNDKVTFELGDIVCGDYA